MTGTDKKPRLTDTKQGVFASAWLNLQAGIGLGDRVHLLAKGSTVVNTVDRRTLVLCSTSRQHL